MENKEENQGLSQTDVIRCFLKENLSVQISTEKQYDYGNEYTIVRVGIYLGDEEICTSSDTIR